MTPAELFLPVVAGAFVALTIVFLFLAIRRLFGPNRAQERINSMVDQITRSEIELELEQNDVLPNNTWTGFWYNLSKRAGIQPRTTGQPGFIALGALLLGLLFGLLVWPAGGISGIVGAVLEAAGLVAGLFAFYTLRANARLRNIEKALPGFLQGIRANLSADSGIQQAILEEAGQVEGPLGDELKVVRDEVNVGIPLTIALRNFANRVNSREIKFLVASIQIATDAGSNVEGLIITIQDLVEARQDLARKLATGTVEARITLIVLAAAVPAAFLFMFYASPETQKFWASFVGIITIGVIVVLDAIGIFAVKKLVDRVRNA